MAVPRIAKWQMAQGRSAAIFLCGEQQERAAICLGMGDANGFAETCSALRATTYQNVRNQWVHFRINDVYFPDPARILMELHGTDVLQGKIIDMSDSGAQQEAFAVVEVEGIAQPVVVPMNRIKGLICE